MFHVQYEDGTIHEKKRQNHWFHCDAALGGGYMPYLEKAYDQKMFTPPTHFEGENLENWKFPVFDMRLEQVNSIVTSGHKWPGSPWPTGVFLMRKSHQIVAKSVGYIEGSDTTFAGSRNGMSPMILWS